MALETALALAAKPLVTTIVEKLVTPKIEEFSKWCKKNYKEFLIPKAEHFEEYLERSYTKYSIVNTLVFHNSQRLLKEIYVAQTLVKEHRTEDDEETSKIDRLPISLIKKYQKILITDTAGMGKSTILKRIFIYQIDKGLNDVGIPIYIELNKLNKNHKILNQIQEELSSLSKKFDNDLLLMLIQTGGFIFFLDGYDEISISDRNEVTNDIHTFISKAGTKNYFILTSRPEDSLSSFGDFQLFKIRPLTKEEAYKLLKKYDQSNNKELSSKLVELLESGEYDSIEEFMENPLLVSLLFTSYDYNRSIPLEKHHFYEKVFEAYFEKHDNTKVMKKREKYSGLNQDDFDRILRFVGYYSLISIGVKFNKDTILNTIRKAKVFSGITSFYENDLLKDLVSTVPLFCKDGTDYKWIHKSLMEYFAARFIFCDTKENQDRILSGIYKSAYTSKYLNMLDLYFDIDPKGFSKNITLPFCENYLHFYEGEKNNAPFYYTKDLINERISLLSMGECIFLLTSAYSKENLKIINQIRKNYNYYYSELYNGIKIHIGFDVSIMSEFMMKKMPKLFVFKSKFIRDWPATIANTFEQGKVYFVNVKLGEKNSGTYAAINSIRFYYDSKLRVLNYMACKKEADSIRKNIDEMNDFLDEPFQ